MDKRTSEPLTASADKDDKSDKSDEVSAIVGDIDQTRAKMSSTVDEIEQRLSPAHLKEQIAELKESALGQYHEAKDHLKDDLAKEYRDAKAKLEQEMAEARLRMNLEIEHAKQAVHDATVGRVEHMVHDAQETVTEAKTTVVEVIRANPIPAALVAVGLGWLLMSARSSGSASSARRMRARRESRGYDDSYGYAYAGESRNDYGRRIQARNGRSVIDSTLHDVQDGVKKVGHRIGEGASEVGHKVQEVGHKVQEGASQLAHQAQDAAHNVGEKVSNLAHQASEGVENLAHRATEGVGSIAHRATESVGSLAHRATEGVGALAHDTRDAASLVATTAADAGRSAYRGVERGVMRAEQGFENALRDNPLAVGAVALAVGAAIGLALPHTEREDEWLGETRDRLLDRAQNAAHDVLAVAERKAEDLAGELAPNRSQPANTSYGYRANI